MGFKIVTSKATGLSYLGVNHPNERHSHEDDLSTFYQAEPASFMFNK